MRSENLIIDTELERLIPHLSDKEFQLLEESILSDGCREPIRIWKRTILDGHNRYRICKKHGIPFKTQTLEITSRDEAIVWMCINQMARRNISEETRYYLIGKRYEAEKRMGAKNPKGRNQYNHEKEDCPTEWDEPLPKHVQEHRTASRLGKLYNTGHNTIESYGRYARAIDQIEKIAPSLTDLILRGDVFVSKSNISMIAQLEDHQILTIADAIVENRPSHLQYEDILATIGKAEPIHPPKQPRTSERSPISLGEQTVKSVPVYDPDSEISSLTFTMPSWRASISRTIGSVDFGQITEPAKNAFRQELAALDTVVQDLLKLI